MKNYGTTCAVEISSQFIPVLTNYINNFLTSGEYIAREEILN